MTLLEVVDWEEYPSVRNWKRNLISKSHTKILPKGAWKTRKTYFTRYLKFTGKNPDELIEIALNDSDVVRNMVDSFYRELCKTLQKSSAISACYGTIRGFYSNNGIMFQGWKSPKLVVFRFH